jgi:hypothetical protein
MKNILILCSLIILSSCTESTNFSCPAAKEGKKCKTIAESDTINPHTNPIVQEKITGLIKQDETFNTFTTTRIIPTRSEEKMGKIWFAPYLDDEGNFYDESYAYIIIKPAKWQFK